MQPPLPKLTVGVDPDSKAHGVALYIGKNLSQIGMMTTPTLVELIKAKRAEYASIKVSIEDVLSQNYVYRRNEKDSKKAHAKVALSVGRCQQAQFELMQWLDALEIPYVKHKPQGGNWADDRPMFERVTGWRNQSNPDTRSAAYFGFLEAR